VSLTHEDVIRYLESLSSEELGKLADEVLARVGAPPIAPPVRLERYDSTMGVPIEPPHMGIPSFDVVLRDHGPDKLAVIRALRKALGPDWPLATVKNLVESAPVMVREAVSRDEAHALARALTEAGAVVQVR
jgi:large subunit ribosomal protein L7/L12